MVAKQTRLKYKLPKNTNKQNMFLCDKKIHNFGCYS